ncbi:DegV family protein with EDD domain [Aequitasia blattaphilus]|uniref:DegV family protein n=1 Tax=Aequitasia blattaphilus TaxID=2949332 RepID=A0ABT1E5S2_9FIRM|nr:DegV family protein [Aequitasia blattaphilus]MCP1101188.1 DegV family protein [Aequitasia blattaphilus]MCR8613828.1 DegV family protein [Aequitasia blattaphilus]
MSNYTITANSTVDLPKEWLEERNIVTIPLHYELDGKIYKDKEGLSPAEFFEKLRDGKQAKTSQVNPDEAKAYFEPILKEGTDILHLGFSSGLSGTYNSMRIAGEELQEKYPERKIIVIDSLCACLGEGLLLYKALQKQKEGLSIEELAQWVEENKLHICHNVTVDDLHHLHRGGRVSKATAVIGSAIQIKPMITVDNEGKLVVCGKKRGRKNALHHLVDMSVEKAGNWENDMIMVTHGDCIDDAKYVAEIAKEKLGAKEVLINDIGSVIGGHTGPGVVAIFHMGEKR